MSVSEEVHPTPEALADYALHVLTERRATEVEEHIAECESCVATVRRLRRLSLAWDEWSLATHNEAIRATQQAEALASLSRSESDSRLRRRLEAWLARAAQGAGTALELVLGASRDASGILLREVHQLTASGSQLQFAYAAQPVRVRGKADREPEIDRTHVSASGLEQVEVSADPDLGSVTVQFRDPLPGGRLPLVLLVPQGADLPARIAEPASLQGGAFYQAQFLEVAAGSYMLAFEPW